MKELTRIIWLAASAIAFSVFCGCKNEVREKNSQSPAAVNQIQYAEGLDIFQTANFTVVNVKDPWPGAAKTYHYVLAKAGASIPDSLASFERIAVPVKRIIVTSTTHIPSLEMLGCVDALVGFPQLHYISSKVVRSRIASGKVAELGQNQSINTEKTIDLQPDVFIGYGIDNSNPTLDNLKKSGIRVLLNGDWNEKTALGKAEWIKLFGALFGKQKTADSIFNNIASEYQNTISLAKKVATKPRVMAGALHENKWITPYGDSWGASMIGQAGGDYIWADTKGTGSLSLSFESVLDKAGDADIWIGPAQFTSLAEMINTNPDYGAFRSFKQKNIYSFSVKKGATGGVLYYELGPNRPDLILKDLVKILHPELLSGYKLTFFEKLK